jgi:hypothetical protein
MLGVPTKTIFMIPHSICMELVKESHGSLFVGHNGVHMVQNVCYNLIFWPNTERDIKLHLTSHSKCQACKKTRSAYTYLLPMLKCRAPNKRVHLDLLGPLLSAHGKNTSQLLQMHFLAVHGLLMTNQQKPLHVHSFKIIFLQIWLLY